MYRYYQYKEYLDKVLENIRCRYMGQERPLKELLPRQEKLTEIQFAEMVAQVLTLVVPRTRAVSDEELTEGWRWLRAAVLYLLRRCPEEDHTLRGIMKLASLNSMTRWELDKETLPPTWVEDFMFLPDCLKDLEAVVWLLADPDLKMVEELEKRAGY